MKVTVVVGCRGAQHAEMTCGFLIQLVLLVYWC